MFWFKKKEKKIENKKQELAKIEDKKQIAAEAIVGMDIALYAPKAKVNLTEYQAFPISKIGAMGMAFSPVMEALQSISAQQTGETLYRAILPQGTHLAIAKNGSGLLGTAIRDGQGIVGQAKFQQVVTSPSIPTIKPAMIYAAVVLMEVDKKLDAIQETGEQILSILEEKEKAELQGDFDALMDVFEKYKFNTNNEKYKDSKLVQVQGIARTAQASIRLYQERLDKEFNKQTAVHSDCAVEEKALRIEKIYENYQQALYMYSLATFLEVMLLENFDKAYLESVSNTLQKYGDDYTTLYEQACQMIEGYSQSSMESGAAKMLSKAMKGMAKAPLVNKIHWDEGLLTASERLEKRREERTAKTVEKLVLGAAEIVTPFVENIQTVNTICNENVEFLMDKENLYIKQN